VSVTLHVPPPPPPDFVPYFSNQRSVRLRTSAPPGNSLHSFFCRPSASHCPGNPFFVGFSFPPEGRAQLFPHNGPNAFNRSSHKNRRGFSVFFSLHAGASLRVPPRLVYSALHGKDLDMFWPSSFIALSLPSFVPFSPPPESCVVVIAGEIYLQTSLSFAPSLLSWQAFFLFRSRSIQTSPVDGQCVFLFLFLFSLSFAEPGTFFFPACPYFFPSYSAPSPMSPSFRL